MFFCVFIYAQASLTVLHGPILDEVHQQLNPWVSQVNYGSYNHEMFFFCVTDINITPTFP